MNSKFDVFCRGRFYRTISTILTYLWQHTFAKIGEDWVFLALLGIMMAVISFVMDEGIDKCNAARRILYDEISGQSTDSEQRVENLTNLFT